MLTSKSGITIIRQFSLTVAITMSKISQSLLAWMVTEELITYELYIKLKPKFHSKMEPIRLEQICVVQCVCHYWVPFKE